MKVVIVGGGCAGLTALHTLKKNGHEVLVLEKEDIAGGRMQLMERDGFCLDRCAQMVHPGYKSARALMEELDMLELYDTDMVNLRIYDDGDMILPMPSKDPVELAKTMQWMAKMNPLAVKEFMDWSMETVDGLYEGSADWISEKDLDPDMSFGEFVEGNFGKDILEMLAQPLMGAIALEDSENISMAYGIQIMWTVLCGEAYVLKRGLGSLAMKIVDMYSDCVITGTPVTEIVVENDKVLGVKTDKDFYEADLVICAAPATKTLKIIPNLPKTISEPLSKVKYSPGIHTMMAVDRPMVANDVAGVVMPRSANYPFSVASFESTKKTPDAVPFGKDCVTTYIYGDNARRLWNLSDEEIGTEVHESLMELFDHMPEDLLFTDITKVAEANYTMPPGSATAIQYMRENHYRDVEGLFLCGDYMYTGSYESAINAGKGCAEVVMGLRETI